MPNEGPSLTVFRSSPSPRARIVCFPYAGGTAAPFRTWPAAVGGDVEVAFIHLPGRYDRMGGQPFRSVAEASGPVADVVVSAGTLPTALFGHSLGALLAFEVARVLPRDIMKLLVVSGSPAPHLVDAADPIAGLPDDAFLEQIRLLGATPDEVLANPELVALTLPTLRGDFAMAEGYRFDPAGPLACPILALGGDSDPYLSERALLGWHEHTNAETWIHRLPGDHFFLNHQRGAVLALIRRAVYDVCGVAVGGPPPLRRVDRSREWRPSIVMTRGLPAAGKTSWARREVERQGDRPIRISLDDLRQMFFERRVSPEGEAFLLAARDALVRLALDSGRDVILDATNLDPAFEDGVRDIIDGRHGVRLDFADFTSVPLETCIRRDHSRERPVGEAVIRDMFRRFIRSDTRAPVPPQTRGAT
jgi:medium-chain acyl-[acyl-carrier-protein] hydrolase